MSHEIAREAGKDRRRLKLKEDATDIFEGDVKEITLAERMQDVEDFRKIWEDKLHENTLAEATKTAARLARELISKGICSLAEALQDPQVVEALVLLGKIVGEIMSEIMVLGEPIAEACETISEQIRKVFSPPTKKDAPRKIGNVRGIMGTVRQPYRARSRI